MASAKQAVKPNPENPKNVYHIGGIQVEFPYRPYGSQFAFMGRVISTLDRAQKEGHCHALIESPTGTGKSLSLLCSTLAWQQNYKLKNQYANISHSKPDQEAITDPLAYGGGFVPEEVSSSIPASGNLDPAGSVANNNNQKKKAAPTIYYASRTHSQISQVIREFRKTAYRVPMAVLASRKHYCTNQHIRGKETIDEECKLLLKDPASIGCPEFKSAHKVKGHPSLQRGGSNEVHDIEDLVKVGQLVKGCSYYAARSMADDAQLVFCPYNYIVSPVVRGAMDVDIKGAIVIFDEAHNMEDIARDAGSVDIEEGVLDKLRTELEQLQLDNPLIYQPLYEMTQDLISWIERRINQLEKREFQHYVSCWTGDNALRELQEANISQQCFPILLECATKAIKEATDKESDVAHLSGLSVITLEGLFTSLTYFFSRNGCHMLDYQLALQRYIKRDNGNVLGNWTATFSLWCLNPAVVFRDIADLSLSVILTSGTLSPMNSFSSELGVQFGTSMEAPHVVDVDSQVWPAIISTSPSDYPLNASFKTADGYAFQDALGKSLEEIFKIVPGGCLVFFPSYKLMEKLCTRWSETGQWSRLKAEKSLFVEPRGGNQDEFELVLKGYYDSIHCRNNPAVGRKRKVKKVNVNPFNAVDSLRVSKKGGAALLAVCRGKVSEGIDFSDDNARTVIIIGIPFPNVNDIQVRLKKKYNDTYKSSKNLLSGSEWYCHQAFRALNQAAGRCIRHKLDYGAIILLDERFREERNRAYISKWLRRTVKVYDSFDMSLKGLKLFFDKVKESFGKNAVDLVQVTVLNGKDNYAEDESEGFTRKNQKLNKKNGGTKNCKDSIDLDISSAEAFPHEELFVQETPCVDGGSFPASPRYMSKDENSSSTVIEASIEFPDQSSNNTNSLICVSKAFTKAQCSISVTPEKAVTANTCLIPEIESSLSLSVNSRTQKRRMSMGAFANLIEEENCDTADAGTSTTSTGYIKSSVAIRDAIRKIEFGFESCSTEYDSKSSPVMDKRLLLFCSLCQSPLGLAENNLYVTCSLTSSSKNHLRSLLKERWKPHSVDKSEIIPVVITDASFIDQRLYNRRNHDPQGQGIWCEEDGCVFRTIFCPFCSTNDNFLGVKIMATDASNVTLLNKILFYFDHLEIKNQEESRDKASKDMDLLPVSVSSMEETAVLNSIEQFSYLPQQHNSKGWRTTKSKLLRLPQRGFVSKAEG
ncbi:Fanconi anemia group J protein-like protein [Quillaja saponaria]|uniref:DNA 5'-3' helicase FANCJ n=1 Tax=Quillaja saponaria TaxID=32244 RepID=A0AAD7LHG0_QUISA|nr:Fanconi anemia group J protein-like protein [Quillaja saponaria]